MGQQVEGWLPGSGGESGVQGFFWGDKMIRNSIAVTFARHWEYTKNHLIMHLTMVKIVIFVVVVKLYVNKIISVPPSWQPLVPATRDVVHSAPPSSLIPRLCHRLGLSLSCLSREILFTFQNLLQVYHDPHSL